MTLSLTIWPSISYSVNQCRALVQTVYSIGKVRPPGRIFLPHFRVTMKWGYHDCSAPLGAGSGIWYGAICTFGFSCFPLLSIGHQEFP